MPITPIGGAIYANQNMQVQATKQADFLQKLDTAASMAMQNMNEKNEDIKQVRPTEQALELNADNEQKNRQNNEKKTKKKQVEDEVVGENLHMLDIKI